MVILQISWANIANAMLYIFRIKMGNMMMGTRNIHKKWGVTESKQRIPLWNLSSLKIEFKGTYLRASLQTNLQKFVLLGWWILFLQSRGRDGEISKYGTLIHDEFISNYHILDKMRNNVTSWYIKCLTKVWSKFLLRHVHVWGEKVTPATQVTRAIQVAQVNQSTQIDQSSSVNFQIGQIGPSSK